MPNSHLNILLRFTNWLIFDRACMRGIRRYALEQEDWHLRFSPFGFDALRFAPAEDVHAVIGRLGAPEYCLEDVVSSGIPFIDITGDVAELPTVCVDENEVARLAIRHFRERGIPRLAYVGGAGQFSERRGRAFQEEVAACRLPCHIYPSPERIHLSGREGGEHRREFADWLHALEKPVGMLAANDMVANWIAELAEEIGVAIPGDVALLGCDGDPFLAEFTRPTLSSILPAGEEVGYQAARRLHDILSGETERFEDHVKPNEVIARASTDVIAFSDPDVHEALVFLRRHACEQINVDTVVQHVGVSRRTLERKFREICGFRMHDELHRLRMEEAKRLLRETDLPVSDISVQTGFTSHNYFSNVFRKETGLTPNSFRLQ